MSDSAAVTNRVNGYFAAAVRNGVYGVAECVQTAHASGCNNCLQVVVANAKGCLGKKEGTAVDAGCFLKFSDADFFVITRLSIFSLFCPCLQVRMSKVVHFGLINQSISVDLVAGKSSNKVAIIRGGVGGCLLFLFGLLLFLWLRKSKSKVGGRGNSSLFLFIYELS